MTIRRLNDSRLSFLFAFAVIAMASSVAQAQKLSLQGGRTMKKTTDLSDRKVTFDATDGVKIEADWYPAKVAEGQKSPVAILIHMYPATRESWKPLVPLLRDELGIAVLAYDIRGTGGSIEPKDRKLDEGYKNREPAHFAEAWQDTMGAYAWLSQQSHVDVERVLVIGASVGCSIALDFAPRSIGIKGVACLSPGTNYMGLDSLTHIKQLRGSETKVLLMSPEGEYEAIDQLIAAGEGVQVKGVKYAGGKENHGTKLFDSKDGEKVKSRLSKFASGVLGIEKKSKSGEKNDKKEDDDKDDE